jgi:hypothetical protein
MLYYYQQLGLSQCDPNGSPRATSGPRPLIAVPEKLFVHLLLVTTSSSISFAAKNL